MVWDDFIYALVDGVMVIIMLICYGIFKLTN